MWIFSNLGYISVVQKPDDTLLTLRARVASDLDRLRDEHLPTLGPTLTTGGTDYPFRAVATRDAVADAMAKMVRAIEYPNFKSEVAERLGHDRDGVLHQVWSATRKLERAEAEPPRHRRAYGGVVVRDNASVLLRRPTGHFDGYVWTFAKGKPERGESAEECALREVADETGIVARIEGELPSWFSSGSSATKMFLMTAVEDRGVWDAETAEVGWFDLDEAERRIRTTTNARGRARDLAILAAAREMLRRRAHRPR